MKSPLSSCFALVVKKQPRQGGAQRATQNHPHDNNLERNPHFAAPFGGLLARVARFSLLTSIESCATPPVGSYTRAKPWYS